MSFITREIVSDAIKNMQSFYTQLTGVYQSHGMDLTDNLGRRNILMSGPMEHFLAKSLRSSFTNVENDGRTGKSDIVVHLQQGEKELECKLTSPHTSGAIAFQSDFETLEKKGELDYIYIIADKSFEGFVAIHFEGLSVEDFHKLSTGARGKVQMAKHVGMKKANVLIGNAVSSVDVQIEKNRANISKVIRGTKQKLNKWEIDIKSTQSSSKQKLLEGQMDRATASLLNKIEGLCDKEKLIKNKKPRYTFEFESIK